MPFSMQGKSAGKEAAFCLAPEDTFFFFAGENRWEFSEILQEEWSGIFKQG